MHISKVKKALIHMDSPTLCHSCGSHKC